jgi:hypothetical protein
VVNDLAKRYSQQRKPVLFIEHDVDRSTGDRASRWWAAKGRFGSAGTPMTMVDSGYKWTEGRVDFEKVFSANVEAALKRPAEVDVSAFYEREGDTFRLKVLVTNHLQEPLEYNNQAMLHALLVEDTQVIHVDRFVRAAMVQDIEEPIEPGATAAFDLDFVIDNRARANYAKSKVLVLLDYRPASSGPYDLLQAAIAVEGLPTPTPEPTATATRTASPAPSDTPEPTAPPTEAPAATEAPETHRIYLPVLLRRHAFRPEPPS